MRTIIHRIAETFDLEYSDVRAVIEAIRQPTPKMLKAASAAMSVGKRPTQKRVSCKAKHGIRYRAMIDVLLDEGQSGDVRP
jgi:hypothetical protein